MTPSKNATRLMDQGNKDVLNISECGVILDLNILQVGFEKRG